LSDEINLDEIEDEDDEELGGFNEDDFDDEDDDEFECGKNFEGVCEYEGSEDCDECPYRDEEEDDA
jgi:hypothetical protein